MIRKLLAAAVCLACVLALTACGSKEALVSTEQFPDFSATDFAGTSYDNSLFAGHKATVVNFWSNGCGSCIAEMPELEQLATELGQLDVNLVGVATSAGDGEEERAFAQQVLDEKGVTYPNLIPDTSSSFYQDFIGNIAGYPTTYVVDHNGTIVGTPIVGDVAPQKDKLMSLVELAKERS